MDRQPAVIFDRDGTVASCFVRPIDRSDASWAEFNAALRFDRPVPAVLALMRSIRPGVAVLLVSGRAEGDHPGDRRRRFAMQDWIAKHDVPVDHLFMRVGGDRRLDSEVKHEMLHDLILPRFDVRYAVDDRPQVADVWEAHGIPTLRVVDPLIEPFPVG